MFRYVAFCWDTSAPSQLEAVQLLTRRLRASDGQWHPAMDVPGLRLFYASSRQDAREVHCLSDQRGVVLGDVFERRDGGATTFEKPQFDAPASTAIIASRGQHLIEKYWGNYVAFLCSRASSTTWVLRAPMGHLPCLHTSFQGVQIFCSLLHDVAILDLVPLSVDWNQVAARLATQGWLGENGFHNVAQLGFGECAEMDASHVRHLRHWDPYQIASAERIEDASRARSLLRETTRYCVHAWASKHDSILMHHSGGLDSSIVVSCLSDAPTRPRVTCLNFYSPDEDERPYARAMAQRAGFELIESCRNPHIQYSNALVAPLFEASRPYHRCIEEGDATERVAAEVRATALCTGTGGDQLFFSGRPHFTVVDYVHHHGVNRQLLELAWTAGYLEQVSVYRILGRALYRKLFANRRNEIRASLPHHHLLTQRAVELAGQARGSSPISAHDVPGGKEQHILGIVGSGGFYNPLRPLQAIGTVMPLMSQPLVELCLRLPTYVLYDGGGKRDLARHAFAGDLPDMVSTRRVKGKVSKYISTVVWNNRHSLRSLLLEGILVREGLLDKGRLAQVLADQPSNIVKSHREITSAFCLEVWLRQACALDVRAAA